MGAAIIIEIASHNFGDIVLLLSMMQMDYGHYLQECGPTQPMPIHRCACRAVSQQLLANILA